MSLLSNNVLDVEKRYSSSYEDGGDPGEASFFIPRPDEARCEDKYTFVEGRRSFLTCASITAATHIAIFTFYAAVLTILARHGFFDSREYEANRPLALSVYSPAREAAHYDKVHFHAGLHDTSVYRGDPRAELDGAWNHLLSAMNVRLDEETFSRLSRNKTTAVKISDELGGYLGVVNVFHQIHCLRMIRIALTPDLYPWYKKYLSPKHGEKVPEHLDHCIDELRQWLMCSADLNMLTYDWIDEYDEPWGNFNVEHECKNWESVFQWSKDNWIDWKGKLIHPKYGLMKWEKRPDFAHPVGEDGTVTR